MKYVKNRFSFLKENMSQAKSIVQKKMDDFEKLKTLLANNLGYMGKFTEYLMNENIPYSELEKLYSELTSLKTKQVPIDINSLKYEKVLDNIQIAKENLSINSLISKFPGDQKKLARELLAIDSNKAIFLKVSLKDNLDNFISKISRYKDRTQLLNALKIFSKDPLNERDKVLEILKSLDSSVVFSNDDILIVYVAKHSDVQKLGSDTSWCIVGSESMFDRYAKGRHQYIVYNYKLEEFDPKFKIGFTLEKDGAIHAAHDILDSASRGELISVMSKNGVDFKSLVPKVEKKTYTKEFVSKLNSKTSGDTFKEVATDCDIELLPILIKNLLTSNKRDELKRTVVKTCYNRVFGNKEIVTVEEVEDWYFGLTNWLNINYKNLISLNKIHIRNLEDNTIMKAIDMWTKKAWLNINWDGIFGYNSVESFLKEDPTYVQKLSDKMNQMYLELSPIKDDDKDTTYKVKGYKLTQQFEAIMLCLNYCCNREDKSPDYDNIIKSSNKYLIKSNVIKMPIDLSLIQEYNKVACNKIAFKDIDNVIKKDYNKVNVYLNIHEFSNIEKLINHLDNHKITIKVTKSDFKELKDSQMYSTPETDFEKRISSILSKFTNRLISGQIRNDGNLGIVIE